MNDKEQGPLFVIAFIFLAVAAIVGIIGLGFYFRKSALKEAKGISKILPSPTVKLTQIPQAYQLFETKEYSIMYPASYLHTSTARDIHPSTSDNSSSVTIGEERWTRGDLNSSGGVLGDDVKLDIYPKNDSIVSFLKTTDKATKTFTVSGMPASILYELNGLLATIGPFEHNGKLYEFVYSQGADGDPASVYQFISTFKFK